MRKRTSCDWLLGPVLGLGFVTFADVDGHYICAGSKMQCQAVADALDQARAALKSDNLSKDQRAALNRVVSTFGKAGDEHDGVTIFFGKTQSAKATADADSYKDDNGLLKTDITFNSAFFRSLNIIQVAGVLVHERSRGIDGIARGNMDPQNRKQEFRGFIANFKPLPYWFCPQFLSPARIFKDLMPRLFEMYRQFSGSTHGSFIGSVLFSDSPDAPSIDPQRIHPEPVMRSLHRRAFYWTYRLLGVSSTG
jgi:hypothetical protein